MRIIGQIEFFENDGELRENFELENLKISLPLSHDVKINWFCPTQATEAAQN